MPHRIDPAPGQESVWDYPRPPALEDVSERIRVVFGDTTMADTTNAKRVLETSHPPVYYVPPEDICMEQLHQEAQTTFCEWKGRAHYYTVEAGGHRAEHAAWAYADPAPRFTGLRDYVAFYPGKMDACWGG